MAISRADDAPAKAMQDAVSISDPDLRMTSIERVLTAWDESDPAAAAAWKAVNLPPAKKKKLR